MNRQTFIKLGEALILLTVTMAFFTVCHFISVFIEYMVLSPR